MYTQGLQTFNVFHLNWLEQFLPWHPKPPTTKIFEDASNSFSVDKFKANMRCCVSVFMHVCGCHHFQKLSNNLLVRFRRDTYSRTKMLKSLGFFQGPNRRDQAFTEPSKRTKGRPPTEKCWTLTLKSLNQQEKKIIEISENHSHPLSPSPRKQFNLEFFNGSPGKTANICRVNLFIQETRMDPPNLGRLVSLLVVGLNQPLFLTKKICASQNGRFIFLKFSGWTCYTVFFICHQRLDARNRNETHSWSKARCLVTNQICLDGTCCCCSKMSVNFVSCIVSPSSVYFSLNPKRGLRKTTHAHLETRVLCIWWILTTSLK